jgi:hypothetical protein
VGKYDPLKSFLEASGAEEVPMSFEDIEALLGSALPDSRRYPAWWSNNPSNNVMTRVWLDAGYRTERVDVEGHKVVFRRRSPATQPNPRDAALPSRRVADVVARLQRKLAGTIRVAEGVDLSEPTGEVWDAETQ